MENTGIDFVEKQLQLNKKVTKTLTGFVGGLETQDRFNKQLIEYVKGQDERLDTLRRMIVGLTTFVAVTMLGVLIIVIRMNS